MKELLSYADVRKQSKDKRHAVKNLAQNFLQFKNNHLKSSEAQLSTQMLIVDSLEQEFAQKKRIERSRSDMKSPRNNLK